MAGKKNPEYQAWVKENTGKHHCGCGCGEIVKPTHKRFQNRPTIWFINYHQNRGENHPRYNDGRIIAKGYVWFHFPGYHPRKTPRNYVKRCWLVMEKKIGRYLKDGEVVHHINHSKLDDRPNNLTIVTREEHGKIHNTGSGNWSYRRDVDAEQDVLPLALKGYPIRKMMKTLHCSQATIIRRLRHLRKVGLLSPKTALPFVTRESAPAL